MSDTEVALRSALKVVGVKSKGFGAQQGSGRSLARRKAGKAQEASNKEVDRPGSICEWAVGHTKAHLPLCSLKSKLGRRHVRGVVRHSHMQTMWPPAMAHGYGQMHWVWQQHLPHLFALCQTCSLCHLPQTFCDVLRSWTWEMPKELQAMARHRRLA